MSDASKDRKLDSRSSVWALRLAQHESWQRGKRLNVETLIATSNGAPLDDDALLELILSEFELREEFGERPKLDEYVRRFPQLSLRLERLFAVREAMDDSKFEMADDQATNFELSPRKVPPSGGSFNVLGETVSSIEIKPIDNMLGSYCLLEKLGEGGMGAVYKARHQKLKKLVSIKVLPQHLTRDADLTARFQREMESVGALDHPNIVRAMDAGEVDGTHFLVMEFVDGDDLAKVITKQGPLSVVDTCAVIRQAASALQHAHDHGLVHRDIKPSNLMWTRDKNVKVLDLGLARWQLESQPAAAQQLTASGQTLGTIDYMSPEQAHDSKRVDRRTDIYSLGCTLYFLLIGQPLYAGRGRVEKLFAHRAAPIPSLLLTRGDVPPELDRIYQRMIAKRREDRYGSMREVVAALDGLRLDNVDKHPMQTIVTADVSHTDSHSATAIMAADQNELSSTTRIEPLADVPRASTRAWLWAAGVGTAAVLLAAIIFAFKTHTGTIIVEVNEPGARVEVLSDQSVIEEARQSDSKPLTIRLDPGKHCLRIQKDGFEPFTEDFSIESGGRKTFGAKLLAITGWRGWPKNAPVPALAPFYADEAKHHQEAWARYLNVPVEYTNSLGMSFHLIPPGQFLMGSDEQEIELLRTVTRPEEEQAEERVESEGPQHRVCVPLPIFMSIHETSQSSFTKVMGWNRSSFSPTRNDANSVAEIETSNLPVEMVSWNDAAEFCRRLSEHEGLNPMYAQHGETVTFLSNQSYRLPTEPEWEFACRAGAVAKFSKESSQDDELSQVAWFAANSGRRTHVVGGLKANPFGIFDLQGNVCEWCEDGCNPSGYSAFRNTEAINQRDSSDGYLRRIIRGGGWDHAAVRCRPAFRDCRDIAERVHQDLGFRTVLMVDAVRHVLKVTGPALPNLEASRP